MNKFYRIIFLSLLSVLILSNQGCDILNNYFLNLPLKQDVTATGSNTTISQSETVYLSDYDAYVDNVDNIVNINYLAALYRTLNLPELTPDLEGSDIVVTVTDGDGTIVFTRSLPTAVAADYIDTPYEVELNSAELALMNQYLQDFRDPVKRESLSFTGTITMSDVTASEGPPYTLTGQVEILLELELEP